MKNFKTISLMFPLYKDKRTVKKMIFKSLKILKKIKKKYEIVIVDDGCPENSGNYAKRLSKNIPSVKVIFHKKNLGYGAALKTGIKNCKYDWIFQIDGDAEYDVNDLFKLIKATKKYDLVITYRYEKKYTTYRIVISWVYNKILRLIFKIKFRDISTGSRLVNRKIIKRINLRSTSPFIGAELAIRSLIKGYKVGEVGINQYPLTFRNESVSLKNIFLTIKDMILLFIKL